MRHDGAMRQLSARSYSAVLAERETLRNRLGAVSPDGDSSDVIARAKILLRSIVTLQAVQPYHSRDLRQRSGGSQVT